MATTANKKGSRTDGVAVSGGVVFRQIADGSTRVSVKPEFGGRKFSQAQIDHQNKVRVAASYASAGAGRSV